MLKRWFGRRRAQSTEEQVPKDQSIEELVAIDLIKIGGPPELDFLFIAIPPLEIQRALDGWKWLDLQDLTAIAVSAFGELFFRTSYGSIQQLDMVEGRLREVATSVADLTAQLQGEEARDELLLAGMVIGARSNGLILGDEECYDFKIAPVLGGKMSSDEMQKLSFLVKVHIAGQLHEQVKDLPPGTRITNFSISD